MRCESALVENKACTPMLAPQPSYFNHPDREVLIGFSTYSTSVSTADEFILVIGGEVGEYGDASFISDSATLISPDPIQAPVPECIRNLAEFPLQIYGGAGAVIGTRIDNSKVASLQD